MNIDIFRMDKYYPLDNYFELSGGCFVHPLNNLGLVIIQDAQLSVSGNGFYLPPIGVLVRK